MTREQINESIREDMREYIDSPNLNLRIMAKAIIREPHSGREPYQILAGEYRWFKRGTEEKEVAYTFMRKYDVPKLKIEARKKEQEEIERKKAEFDKETEDLKRYRDNGNVFYFILWLFSFITGFLATSFFIDIKQTGKRAKKYTGGDS